MPLSHRRLALWYRQLGQQLEAGLPFPAALQATRGAGAPSAALDLMAQSVSRGGTAEAAFRAAGWIPVEDVLALSAAAQSGRLPRTLENLCQRHELVAATHLRLLMACLYPLGILHFGLLLLPVMRMIDWEKGFHWSTARYVIGVATTLLPLWLVLGTLWILLQRGSPLLSRLAWFLPGARAYVRHRSLADVTFLLVNLLEAGVSIGRAWAAVGEITPSPALRVASHALAETAIAGQPPGNRMGTFSCFPADFVSLYRTGESTGQLDANLHRLTAQHLEAAGRALTFVTVFYPTLVFLLVAGAAAYYIISMYAGYLRMLDKLV